ncbi:MAG: helix-turn-helix transcriptional regulator [Clostridium celatum]|nr:helix-turn-helix transcriptional regulator [Clostridium celatum]
MLQKRLKGLRVESGLTQEQISEIVNISRQSYAKYEDGSKPPIDVLIALADYYAVSLDYLVGISDIRERTYLDPKIQDFINDCLEIYYKQKDLIIKDYEKSKE